MSDYFHIVSALCRAVIKDEASSDVLKQIERLQQAYEKDGAEKEAKTLLGLMEKADKKIQLSPSRVVLSKANILVGQELTENVKVPVDKESGSPLAEIIYPGSIESMPLFSAALEGAVNNLVSEWEHLDALNKIGVTPFMTALLFGAPGTGKTQLALHIASRLSMPVVLAKLDGLVSSFLGTSARNITNLFIFAARYRCVLLLDEFDAVAKARDDKQEVGEIKRVVNTLLQCLDARGKNGITIAVTNHEALLDSAVWRRFSARIHVPRPDSETRNNILEKYLNPLSVNQVQKKFLVWMTDNYTGSDIENLCNYLKRYYVVNADNNFSFFDAVKSYILISKTNDDYPSQLIQRDDEALANELKAKEIFNQKELADLFDKHPSTISRWISDSKLSLR